MDGLRRELSGNGGLLRETGDGDSKVVLAGGQTASFIPVSRLRLATDHLLELATCRHSTGTPHEDFLVLTSGRVQVDSHLVVPSTESATAFEMHLKDPSAQRAAVRGGDFVSPRSQQTGDSTMEFFLSLCFRVSI